MANAFEILKTLKELSAHGINIVLHTFMILIKKQMKIIILMVYPRRDMIKVIKP